MCLKYETPKYHHALMADQIQTDFAKWAIQLTIQFLHNNFLPHQRSVFTASYAHVENGFENCRSVTQV